MRAYATCILTAALSHRVALPPTCSMSEGAEAQLLYWCAQVPSEGCAGAPDEAAPEAAETRTRAWVERTLSPRGLKLCPYTHGADRAATGLEDLGVAPAPIHYAVCAADDMGSLMAEFWAACTTMIAAGEEGCSSVLLAAPRWDERWSDWCEVVFPALEASVEAARLDRALGVVCFHPQYSTPEGAWRFGHLHPTSRLREYLDEHDPRLAAATSDDELAWAGSYQRRSPHATINVLWANQLEIAEARRRSSSLYTRNLRTVLAKGREALQQAAEAERR